MNYLVESGRPVSTVARMRTDGINFFPYGRGDLGRTPVYSQTDLLLQQRIPVSSRRVNVNVGVNVINLFDQMTVMNVVTTPYRDAFNISAAAILCRVRSRGGCGRQTTFCATDPRYRLASAYQAARSIMAQLRVTF